LLLLTTGTITAQHAKHTKKKSASSGRSIPASKFNRRQRRKQRIKLSPFPVASCSKLPALGDIFSPATNLQSCTKRGLRPCTWANRQLTWPVSFAHSFLLSALRQELR